MHKRGWWLLLILVLLVPSSFAATEAFDVLITGAHVVDGSGNPWYLGDVGIRDGVIVEIGKLAGHPAKKTIAADGLTLTPGFIDMMAGTSVPLLVDPVSALSKLRQGVTTMMSGEGDSMAPQDERTIKDLKLPEGFPHWTDFAEYGKIIDARGLGLNVIHNVGAAQVRRVVIGDEDRPPTPEQMAKMKAIVAKAMQDGSVGISTALIYPPGTYAKTEELVELSKVAAEYGGVYFSHMRNESNQLLTAIREVIRISEEAHIPVHIYHLKAAGQDNWPLMAQALALIQSARDRGLDVSADVYPYIRNGLGLAALVPPQHFAKGTPAFLATLSDKKVRTELRKEIETTTDWENWYRHTGSNWDNVLVVRVPASADRRFEGKSIEQIAKLRGVDVWDTFFDLVQMDGVDVDPKTMNEEQKNEALRANFVSIDSDSEPMNPAVSTFAHPRTFGTFSRILAKYVREEKVLSLENAVREMTSLPANQLHIRNRGRIAVGMAADLALFDPAKVQDTATYEKPMSYALGMEYVLVNGQVAIEAGKATGVLGGKLIRRQPIVPMLGILVHGNNHFILAGPPPDEAQAVALARYWSVVQIGEQKAPVYGAWTIRDKEFRENLEWAVVLPGDRPASAGVMELLAELSARGIIAQAVKQGCW